MGSILVQISHLLVVAFNHYMGTLRPLHYASTMTPSTLRAILIVLWVLPSESALSYTCNLRGKGTRDRQTDTDEKRGSEDRKMVEEE
ncbi:hypothetical protein Pmani_039805 [Petrolisthes manimaculis]|uniref:Uncharacterized protein n=1 Tax=Petrolisthes manimaculis TaxID=1843537 RepID=A0AAE1TJ78_9EUCA|nr:hypothetical protein Pmani_039805 [Petrolisthes manimaculis]